MELESLLADSESRLVQAQGQQHSEHRSTEDLRQELDNNAGTPWSQLSGCKLVSCVLGCWMMGGVRSGLQDALHGAAGQG